MFQFQAVDSYHVDTRWCQFRQIVDPLVSQKEVVDQFAIFVMARWQVVVLQQIVLIELLAEFADLADQVDSTYLFDCLVDFVLVILVLLCLDQFDHTVDPLPRLVNPVQLTLDRLPFAVNLIHPLLEQHLFVVDLVQPFVIRVLLVENQFELVELLGCLVMMQGLIEHHAGFQMLVGLGFELDQIQHF